MLYRILLSFIISIFGVCTYAQEIAPSEYQVKAAFIYNFLNFVEWPDEEKDQNATICVLGEDPFGPSLDALDGETARGKRVTVRRVKGLKGVRGCSTVFISDSEKNNIPDILVFVEGSPVLTVSDTEGFAEAGGVIGFVTENNRVRFHINLRAAGKAHLKVSSKLLMVGRIVGD